MSRSIPLAAALLVANAAPALAQGRPSTTAMSCGQAAAIVRARGAIVLGTGGMTYDRFVTDKRFCAATEQVKPAFAPSADVARCFVGYTCFEPFIDPSDAFH